MNAPRSRAGSRFGPYELRSLLGRGGMGEVFEAYDTNKERVVALKILPEEFAQDPTYQERFRRESQAAARLAEPHVIPIHDWGEIDGVLYIDMRLVRGENLRALLRRQGTLEPERAIRIINQVAAALDAAHAAGLVHRDIKPANILVTPADFAYLADFGIARSQGDSANTLVGTAVGSYIYMAPERFDAGPVTGRADTYSLACVLHECLTGATPFPVQSVSTLVRSHLSEPPPRPSLQRSDVPPALDAVIAHAMSKSPADRFATAGEFAGAARAAVGLSPGYGSATTESAPPRLATGPAGVPFSLEHRAGDQPDSGDDWDRTPVETDAPQSSVASQSASGRVVSEPTTFQPFGPQGPTIAAQFQPRGEPGAPQQPAPPAAAAPSAATPTTVMHTGAGTGQASTADSKTQFFTRDQLPPRGADPAAGQGNPRSDDDVPAKPAPPARGYETTGSLRIIPPEKPDSERNTGSDLPVIRPGDPTRVLPGEFQFAPLPPSSEQHESASLQLPPHADVPPRSTAAGADDEYESGDYPRPAPHPGQDNYGPEDYPDDAYGHGDYDRSTPHTGYEDAEHGEDEQRYAYGDYEHPAADSVYGDYAADDHARGYGDESDGYDYGDQSEYDSEADGYDDAYDKPKTKSAAVPIVLALLGFVLAAAAAVVGWQVLGKSGTDNTSTAAHPANPATAASVPSSATTAPDTTATTTSSTPPAGATTCSPTFPAQGKFTKSAVGSSVTSCGFAEAVRKAYGQAVESGSSAPSTVVAASPTTGRSYTMNCTAAGQLVTCTGGENAVVYVY